MILVHDTRRQPGEPRNPLIWMSLTTKKAGANEARHQRPRLHESIRGECFHLHSRSRIVLGSLSESIQPALQASKSLFSTPTSLYWRYVTFVILISEKIQKLYVLIYDPDQKIIDENFKKIDFKLLFRKNQLWFLGFSKKLIITKMFGGS